MHLWSHLWSKWISPSAGIGRFLLWVQFFKVKFLSVGGRRWKQRQRLEGYQRRTVSHHRRRRKRRARDHTKSTNTRRTEVSLLSSILCQINCNINQGSNLIRREQPVGAASFIFCSWNWQNSIFPVVFIYNRSLLFKHISFDDSPQITLPLIAAQRSRRTRTKVMFIALSLPLSLSLDSL